MSAALEAILDLLKADLCEERDRVNGLVTPLTKRIGELGTQVATLRTELDDLKARMPADDPCDVEHMREISS